MSAKSRMTPAQAHSIWMAHELRRIHRERAILRAMLGAVFAVTFVLWASWVLG